MIFEKQYENLTDCQGKGIEKIEMIQERGNTVCSPIFKAILWVNRTGLQWRELNKSSYPSWQSVCYYFR